MRILYNNETVEIENGMTLIQAAKALGADKGVCVALVDGEVKDLRSEVGEGQQIEFLDFGSPEGKSAFWHTSSHVLAQAVKRLYPNAKLAIGPSIDNGFYYDFDSVEPFTPESLEAIENEVAKVIKENPKITKYTLDRKEAVEKAKNANEPYKVELIEALEEGEEPSFYDQGEFSDLCAGPHLMGLSPIKAFKVLSVAGAYWRGDEKNQMLQRIYAISFPSKEMLDDYLEMLEEAKRRDHRKLGRELDLFSIQDEGPGFPFFHPKGMVVRNELENFWKVEHAKRGYDEIKSPIILDADLWRRSGHWDHYKDNMYFTFIDEREFAVKPMNCPGAMLLYKRQLHSYRDLPLRYGELGLVHRHEKSGALHGLMRVRNFTQDDAHIFLAEDQVHDEINRIIDFTNEFYACFGFEYTVELSTRPEDSIGTEEQWEIATSSLAKALESKGIAYKINEGDGAFYGPKIDFHLKDSIGRTWQCGTIQLDFQMPERFELVYVDQEGNRVRPIVIHRVIFGSIERFIAILVEHFAGDLPLWLSPVQANIIPISEDNLAAANDLLEFLAGNGIRAKIDSRNETLSYRVRESELQKIPYCLVIGAKEAASSTVSVRSKKKGSLGVLPIQELVALIDGQIKSKEL